MNRKTWVAWVSRRAYPITATYLIITTTLILCILVQDAHADDHTRVAAFTVTTITGDTTMDADWFADTASWALIVGVLSPLLISVVQQPTWAPKVRVFVSVVVSLVIGVGTVLANGGFEDVSGGLGILALVLVSTQAAYRNIYKPTGLAPSLEAATSKGQRDPA